MEMGLNWGCGICSFSCRDLMFVQIAAVGDGGVCDILTSCSRCCIQLLMRSSSPLCFLHLSTPSWIFAMSKSHTAFVNRVHVAYFGFSPLLISAGSLSLALHMSVSLFASPASVANRLALLAQSTWVHTSTPPTSTFVPNFSSFSCSTSNSCCTSSSILFALGVAGNLALNSGSRLAHDSLTPIGKLAYQSSTTDSLLK